MNKIKRLKKWSSGTVSTQLREIFPNAGSYERNPGIEGYIDIILNYKLKMYET
jgi:hypothetical protein